MVAMADGPGLEAVFRSLGAVVVGGSDPAPEDVVRGIEAGDGAGVIVIPNGSAALPLPVRVIGAHSVPAGLAAAAAFDPMADAEANVAEMSKAAAAVRVGDVSPEEGGSGWLARVGEDILGIARSAPEAARRVAERLSAGPTELATVIAGAGAEEVDDVVAAVRSAAARAAPEAEVQLIHGGQPQPRYFISAE
jgi:uncharacterized protein